MNNDEICKRAASLYAGRNWHNLSVKEREMIEKLEEAGFLEINDPPNGFVAQPIVRSDFKSKEEDMGEQVTITVSGRARTGKSTIAALIAKALTENGIKNVEVKLLDFEHSEFVLANAPQRLADINDRGISVVVEEKQTRRGGSTNSDSTDTTRFIKG